MSLIFFVLIASPLFFGSVHTPAWLTFSGLIIISGLLSIKKEVKVPPLELLGYWCLSIAAYGVCQYIWGSVFKTPLPVKGIYLGLPNQSQMESTIFSFSVSATLFFILAREENFDQIKKIVIFSGLVVCVIALSHWLSDNGRLFWFFEPTTVAESNRARWPFVNPNHLGAFLIFPFFFILEEFFLKLHALHSSISQAILNSHNSKLSLYLTSPDLPSLLFTSSKASIILVTILASLSRGVIVPLSILSLIGVIHFSFTSGARLKSFSLWISLLFSLAAFLALYEQKEILEQRLVYGIVAAIDDLRWLMLRESIPLIFNSPIFGVGLGLWEERFFTVASSTFVGLKPEYLHSDTAQLIIETGIIGLVITCFFWIKVFRGVYFFKGKTIFPELAVISFLLSSTFDFPLRIPSVVWMVIASISVIISNAVLRKPIH